MDGYPRGSLDRNVPLLVASGLVSAPQNTIPALAGGDEDAIHISSKVAALSSREAKVLEQYLGDIDDTKAAWNPLDTGKAYRFRVLVAGRSFSLPPRQARLPPVFEPSEIPLSLYSPFSPLSPSSALYPDGLINVAWLQKHQELVPSVFLCFYSLSSGASGPMPSDDKLKVDIGNVKTSLLKSGYRTRLAVVFLGDRQSHPSRGLDPIHERLEGIRKSTGLDPKSFFYIPPQESPAHLEDAVDGVLSSLYIQSIEYHLDLARHTRKKRGRGTAPQPTVPPTSGTSQTLALPGWQFRYDFKAAIFAEFRQDTDVALRLFDQCYDTLLGPDLLGIIPSWNPRWNEARLLSDIITVRSIRCLCCMGKTTTAVRRWQTHRDRIKDLLDRRGRGTMSYGWEAWEARWAMVMAELIERLQFVAFGPSSKTIFLQPEKSVMRERLKPWELLHHPGYWYRLAAGHLERRRSLAYTMPEQDRQAPGSSPASHVASKAYTYDTYLCPEPHQELPLGDEGVNHSKLIIDCLKAAWNRFSECGQFHFAAELSLECAKEMVRANAWSDAVAMLRPLWKNSSFRAEGWWLAAEDLGWTLRAAAAAAGLGDIVVAVDWELMDSRFSQREGWHYDLKRSLEGVASENRKPTVRLNDDLISSFVSASFAFQAKRGRSGDICWAQLTVTSNAQPKAVPVAPRELAVEFDGSFQTVLICHDEAVERPVWDTKSTGGFSLTKIDLEKEQRHDDVVNEDSLTLKGTANLELVPGRSVIFEMGIPLREPGAAKALTLVLSFEEETYDLEYRIEFRGEPDGDVWYGPSPLQQKTIHSNAHAIEIQPKPPKLDIKIPLASRQYYSNEPIDLPFEILNAEDDSAVAKLTTHVRGENTSTSFRVRLGEAEEVTAATNVNGSAFINVMVGTVAPSSAVSAILRLDAVEGPTTYDVTIKVSYHLTREPETPIIQSTTFQLYIVDPFEASYDFLPRLHPEPWPSLFNYESIQETSGEKDPDGVEAIPKALKQKWCLLCHYASFASDELVIVGMEAQVVACAGGTAVAVTNLPVVSAEDGIKVAPQIPREAEFDVLVQKPSVDDRGPVSMDIAFVIKWKRLEALSPAPASSPTVNTTTMLVPTRYVVLGTEPRVLASVESLNTRTGQLNVQVTIENTSSHFLTFGVGMEPSDEFAFSGPKHTTLHLLPISRRSVTYSIVPLTRGQFVRLPLLVRDKYFQKILRVLPTEGMKIDKDGLLLWIPPANSSSEGAVEQEVE